MLVVDHRRADGAFMLMVFNMFMVVCVMVCAMFDGMRGRDDLSCQEKENSQMQRPLVASAW